MTFPIQRKARVAVLRGLLMAGGLLLAHSTPAALLDPQIRAAQFERRMGEASLALRHLQAARDQGQLDHQAAQADLLLGELLVQQGLDLRAAKIFLALGDADGAAADAARFQLGRLLYRRGDDATALKVFAQIRQPLPEPAREQERLLLEGELLLRQERLSEAEQRLRRLLENADRRSEWAAFARFNLAVALFRSGREDEARDLLRSLSELKRSKDRSLRTLADKANLTLAYDRLEGGDIDAATDYFKKGRLDGPVSNNALMGLGRAWAAQERYKKALVPWLKLSKRDPADPLVQDALLAVPYGFGKLNAYKQALQYYQQALSVFKLEQERLGKVEAQVNGGEMVRSLAAAFDEGDVLARDVLPALPQASGASHLWRLFSTHEFQELLRNHVRADRSLKKIARWTSQIRADEGLTPARREALLARATTLETRLKALSDKLQTRMQSLALKELEQRRKRLQAYTDETRFSIAQIYDYAAKRWGGQ